MRLVIEVDGTRREVEFVEAVETATLADLVDVATGLFLGLARRPDRRVRRRPSRPPRWTRSAATRERDPQRPSPDAVAVWPPSTSSDWAPRWSMRSATASNRPRSVSADATATAGPGAV
jgi:hypothetical protein